MFVFGCIVMLGCIVQLIMDGVRKVVDIGHIMITIYVATTLTIL